MEKIKIGGIIAVIAVLILVISLAMPWYTMSAEDDDGDTDTQRLSLDLLPERSHSEEDMDNTTTTFTVTSWMATVGTSVSMISLLFIGMAIGTDSKKHAKIGSILLMIGLIFAIVAPLYMMISFPDAVLDDQYDGDEDNLPEDQDTPAESFFGSETQETWREEEVERSWGGGIGWFMSLIGGILLIIPLILIALGDKSTAQRRAVREEETMQQSQYQEPQPQGWEQEPQQTQQSNTCPDCGQPIRYIEEYDGWYCDNCQEYK